VKRFVSRGEPMQAARVRPPARLPMTEASSSSAHPAPHPGGLSMLEKRRIEAEILKEVYLTLKESHGEEMAKKTIAEFVRRSAIEQAQAFAAVEGDLSRKA
jgi:hypothetical protein